MTVSKIDVDPRSGRATFEWDVISTHTGHFKGVPPTNRRVTHHGTTELIIRNGKIVAETSYQDIAAFMKQLHGEDSTAQSA
jgi:predicted ester cyclase